MFCTECGAKIKEGANYCVMCGNIVAAHSKSNLGEKTYKPKTKPINISEKELARSCSMFSKAFIILLVVLMSVLALTSLILSGAADSYSVDAETLRFSHERRDFDFDYYFQTGNSRVSDPYMDDGWKEAKSEYYSLLITAQRLKNLSHFCNFLLCVSILFLFLYFYSSKMQIIVTDKRVYGKAGFGKKVDLPLDKISAVAQNMLHGLTVATSAGKIAFVGIKNRDEVHKAITDLLVERQNQTSPATQVKQAAAQSNADELKKYKELLDCGIISQKEFDAKKKQLLGL